MQFPLIVMLQLRLLQTGQRLKDASPWLVRFVRQRGHLIPVVAGVVVAAFVLTQHLQPGTVTARATVVSPHTVAATITQLEQNTEGSQQESEPAEDEAAESAATTEESEEPQPEPAAEPDPPPADTPEPDPGHGLLAEWHVQSGDTMHSIASRLGVPMENVWGLNMDLLGCNPHLIRVGWKLRLLGTPGSVTDCASQAPPTAPEPPATPEAEPAAVVAEPPAPAPAVNPTVSSQGWTNPGPGDWRLTSTFGWRWGTMHNGIDLSAHGGSCGKNIHAAASGTVIEAGPANGFGLWIRIDHGNGVETRYGHMRELHVSAGQQVNVNDVIAPISDNGQSTGCHLHFEVLVNGQKIDPLTFLRNRGVSI